MDAAKGFISYAHKDHEMVGEFQLDLRRLEFDYPVTFWIDPDLRAGQDWKNTIAQRIGESDIFLLLMSRAFLASDFIANTELPLIHRRSRASGAPVIPIILETCQWASWKAYHVIPHDSTRTLRPIKRWRPVSEGYHNAAVQIARVLTDDLLLKPRDQPAPADLRTQRQDPAGPVFMQQDQSFQIDESGDPSDQLVAADPENARRLTDLHAMADQLATTLEQQDPETVPSNLPRDVRALAHLLDPARGEAWTRIGQIFDRIRPLSRDVDTLRKPSPPGRNSEPVDATLIDALAALVDEAMFRTLQFPSVQQLDRQTTRSESMARVLPLIPGLVEAARSAGVISTDTALSLMRVLEGGEATPADERWVALGIRNLLYRVGGFASGFIPDTAVPGRADDVRLMRTVNRLLQAHGGAIGDFVSAGPDPVKRSFARLITIASTAGLRLPERPAAVAAKPDVTPPDDYMDQAKAMILRGEAPPAAWVPFIQRLEISEPEWWHPDTKRHPFADLRPLRTLTALQHLTLRGTSVENLSPLAHLTALTSLDLEGTRVSDVAPLAGLTALTSLDLAATPVSDVTPLARMTALTSLALGSTRVSDVAPLAGLTALTSLNLAATSVSDVAPLARLTALTSLYLAATPVSDVAPLAGLTALTSLDLRDTPVSDVASLARLTALASLDLRDTWVSDVAPLAGLTALTSLALGGTRVSDVAPLAGLTALTSLELVDTKVSDVAPLARLTALKLLDLAGTRVSDVAPLAGLTALRELRLADARIRNLRALRHLTGLTIHKFG